MSKSELSPAACAIALETALFALDAMPDTDPPRHDITSLRVALQSLTDDARACAELAAVLEARAPSHELYLYVIRPARDGGAWLDWSQLEPEPTGKPGAWPMWIFHNDCGRYPNLCAARAAASGAAVYLETEERDEGVSGPSARAILAALQEQRA